MGTNFRIIDNSGNALDIGDTFTPETLIDSLLYIPEGTELSIQEVPVDPLRVLANGALQFDIRSRDLHSKEFDEPVRLTQIEGGIFNILTSKPGEVFARRAIIKAVWGEDYLTNDHVVDVHVSNTRRKLGGFRRHLDTVRGSGFLWTENI